MGYLFQNYSAHESILTKKKPLSREIAITQEFVMKGKKD